MWTIIVPMGKHIVPKGKIIVPMGKIIVPMGKNIVPMGKVFSHGKKRSSLGKKSSLGKFKVSLGKFRTSHGNKQFTYVPMGTFKFLWELSSSYGNSKLPMGKVIFPMGTSNVPMGNSNIPMGIIKFPMGNVLLISCSDKSDNSDKLGHMAFFLFFNNLSLGKFFFWYLVNRQSQICRYRNGKFVPHSVIWSVCLFALLLIVYLQVYGKGVSFSLTNADL